jgi:hypothetical protein
MYRCLAITIFGLGISSFHPMGLAAPEWQQPTLEELSMTADPAAPGASAVILNMDENDDDNLKTQEIYVREKILTEAARADADAEIRYQRGTYTVSEVAGRTIHPDGTIVPFTAKPFKKLISRRQGWHYQAKAFSLPDVQVGSIIEYRYVIRYQDKYTAPPTWYLQGRYFVHKAHFRFTPLVLKEGEVVLDSRQRSSLGLAWVSILPPGLDVKFVPIPGKRNLTMQGGLKDYYELNASDIKAIAHEEFQPPIEGLSYRVLFYNRFYDTADQFWKGEGKNWSKVADHFIGPGDGVKQAIGQLTLPADTPEQKLHKLYNAVMTVENTDLTREHSKEEEKAAGVDIIKSSDDVWARKRGNSDQIAMLFVGMARAAGFRAYLMAVTNRDDNIFEKELPSMDQLNGDIVIVEVDGNDRFFDPGSRYCTFGQVHWKHSQTAGLRQVDGGTALSRTVAMPYKDSQEDWAARLQMDNVGSMSGIVQMRYTGAPALTWRQAILRGDMTEETKDLEDSLKEKMPAGLTVKLKSLLAQDDPDQPLIAQFNVSGQIATSTSKRMFIPGQLFQVGAKPMFTSTIRENPVYFDYPVTELNDVQITLPAGLSVESMPKPEKEMMQQKALYSVTAGVKGNAVSIVRSMIVGTFLYPASEYAELRDFFGKVNAGDQEQLVLKNDGGISGN